MQSYWLVVSFTDYPAHGEFGPFMSATSAEAALCAVAGRVDVISANIDVRPIGSNVQPPGPGPGTATP